MKQFPPLTHMGAKSTINIAADKRVKVGTKVLVYPGPGQDPIEAKVSEIDEITGLIIEVIFKDADKKEKAMKVKDKIVTLFPLFWSIGKWIKSLFK